MPFDPFYGYAGMAPQDPWAQAQGPAPAPQQAPMGQPTPAGALDPRLGGAYQNFKQAEEGYLASLEANRPEVQGLWDRFKDVGLPTLALGLATGGTSFLPMAAAFAIGATGAKGLQEKQQQEGYDKWASQERYNVAKTGLDAAQGIYDPSARRGVGQRAVEGLGEDGKPYWFAFNPATGLMENTKVPAVERQGSGIIARFQRAVADGLIPPEVLAQGEDEALQWYTDKIERRPTSVIERNEAVSDPTQIAGEEGLSRAGERGQQIEQEIFERRRYVETGMDVIDDLDTSLARSMEVLKALESGRAGEAIPLLGSITQYFDETTAMLAAEAVAQALENLQIVNLAPVTEKEFAELKKMYEDVAAGRPANIGRMRASIQRIQRELMKAKKKINRRAARGLGDDFEFNPYPINENDGVSLFPDQGAGVITLDANGNVVK